MNLVYEENNRTLRSIVKYLEIEEPKKEINKAKDNKAKGNKKDSKAMEEEEDHRNKGKQEDKSRENKDYRSGKNMRPARRYATPCSNWENNGSCRYGDQCWFAHAEKNIKSPARKHYQESRNEQRRTSRSPRNESNYEEGDRSRAAEKRPKDTQCRFEYLKTGCRFGPKHCRFMHTKNTDTKRDKKSNIEESNYRQSRMNRNDYEEDSDDDSYGQDLGEVYNEDDEDDFTESDENEEYFEAYESFLQKWAAEEDPGGYWKL